MRSRSPAGAGHDRNVGISKRNAAKEDAVTNRPAEIKKKTPPGVIIHNSDMIHVHEKNT